MANFSYVPVQPLQNETVYFSSDLATPFGRIIRCEWDFGDATASSGVTGGLAFDGSDDYVEVADGQGLDFDAAMTIEFWVKLGNTSQKVVLIGKPQSYQVLFNAGRGYFEMYDGKEYHGSSYSPETIGNDWMHAIVVFFI